MTEEQSTENEESHHRLLFLNDKCQFASLGNRYSRKYLGLPAKLLRFSLWINCCVKSSHNQSRVDRRIRVFQSGTETFANKLSEFSCKCWAQQNFFVSEIFIQHAVLFSRSVIIYYATYDLCLSQRRLRRRMVPLPPIQRTLLIAGDLPYRIAYSTHKVPPSPPMKSQKPWIVPGTIQFKKMEFLIKTLGTVSSAKR